MKKFKIGVLTLLIVLFIIVPQASAKYIIETSIVAVKIRIENKL